MNNNLYHWHDERMVDLEMQEIHRELARANMLKELDASGPGWLVRAAGALRSLLRIGSHASREPVFMEEETFTSLGDEPAP